MIGFTAGDQRHQDCCPLTYGGAADEMPGLASDRDRLHRAFRCVVVHGEITVRHITIQRVPLVASVRGGFADLAIRKELLFVQPDLRIVQGGRSMFGTLKPECTTSSNVTKSGSTTPPIRGLASRQIRQTCAARRENRTDVPNPN